MQIAKSKWPLGAVGLTALLLAVGSLALPAAEPTRVAAVTLSWADKDRTLAHTLEMLGRAAEQRAQIVCLPQECVPTDGGAAATAALEAIRQAAAKAKFYVVANLREQAEGKTFLTSYLIGPDGAVAGKYRKSHRLPCEPCALGDELPVFDTPFGKVGLMIGTDLYWPEVPLVLALKGAELVLCSSAPEPVPQSAPTDVLMRTRAFDDHVTFACANYAGDLPYLCSNHPTYAGSPLGRGCVIDRSGIVVADTATLASLPEREFRAGVAEVIKYGVIYDAALFADLEREMPALMAKDAGVLSRVIARCCEIKAEVVSQDERESGLREILNFGHTIGHGIEAVTEYGRYLHGEALAIGMVAAARLSQKHGGLAETDADRIETLLRRAGFDLQPPDVPFEQLLSAMRSDKKARDGGLRFVLARRMGGVFASDAVSESDIKEVLNVRSR